MLSYTIAGLDIRKPSEESVGQPQPLASGRGKFCTLSILAVAMHKKIDDKGVCHFLQHKGKALGTNMYENML